ncbi:uncharacterized protein JCM15063_003894 [Sporobolomyces koalae]|uniref:uncharacterized protein n=1 Tax=Sporobolomyces koalae TaxID=500713 RepID=UPI00318034E4
MNAHHKKASFRPTAPRAPQHHSSASVPAPIDSGHPQSNTRTPSQLRRAIERVPFGWQVQVLVPQHGTGNDPALVDTIRTDLERSAHCELVRNVNLADLLEPVFLNTYIRTGSLVAISLAAREADDVVAIDGRGRLILNVSKGTYELLGLPGRASQHGSFRQRFIIEISLIDPSFRSGKPGFERVKRLLRAWPAETDMFAQVSGPERTKSFDLVLSYLDNKGNPQPVDLPSMSSVPPRVTVHELNSVAVPSQTSFPPPACAPGPPQKRQRTSSGALRRSTRDDLAWWDTFREWRGLAIMDSSETIQWRSDPPPPNRNDDDDDDDDLWGVERAQCEKGKVTTLSVQGLLHPRSMNEFVDLLLSNPELKSVPFISIVLRPFPHSPISHTSKSDCPIVGTSIRPNGKKRKRGRGRGEEEEADRDRLEDVGGWEVVLKQDHTSLDWWMWEGQ